MSNNLIYPHAFSSFDDLDQDDLAARRGGGKRKAKRAGAGHRKNSQSLQSYATVAYDFDLIALKDDYSVIASHDAGNYFTHPHFDRERAQQRAIRSAMTMACLQFGEHTRAIEATHCTITDQSIADAKLVEVNIADLRGLRLVLTGNCRNVIKTGYWLDVPNGRLAA
jgi:hypothetical protein